MSNKLRVKRVANRSQTTREDKAIMTITHSVGLMSYMTLYDVFGFGKKRIRHYYDAMTRLKEEWSDSQVPTNQLLTYCESKKIDVYGWMKNIPTSSKLKLVGNNLVPNVMNYLEAGFLVNVLMSVVVLKEEFRFSNPMIKKFMDKIEYYVDSYTRKQPGTNIYYLNDKMIIDTFIEEMKLNLETGEDVE